MPEIILMPSKRIVGKNMDMSLSDNKTTELWRSFMIRRNEVLDRVGEEYYSMNIYAPNFSMNQMNMETKFVKWVGVEVSTIKNVPEEMDVCEIPEGLYAVFIHKGGVEEVFGVTINHIFSKWLPSSDYVWDNRPQFEVHGKNTRITVMIRRRRCGFRFAKSKMNLDLFFLYDFSITPIPNKAKSYLTGSLASNCFKVSVSSTAACQSDCFRVNN